METPSKVYCRYCRRHQFLYGLSICNIKKRHGIMSPARAADPITGYGERPERPMTGYYDYCESVKTREADWPCVPELTLRGRFRVYRGLPVGPEAE